MQAINYIIGISGAISFAALVLAMTTDIPRNEDGSCSRAEKIRVVFVTVSLVSLVSLIFIALCLQGRIRLF